MEKKFKEMVPAPMEMERILMRRKDPAERQKVLVFYDSLLQNIEDELDGKNILCNVFVIVIRILLPLFHNFKVD